MTFSRNLGVLKQNSLPSLVQDELEHMFRKGKFTPGHPLREATLATQLGVSRGPIREAFRSLEEKGLVTVEKNRGVFVRCYTDINPICLQQTAYVLLPRQHTSRHT